MKRTVLFILALGLSLCSYPYTKEEAVDYLVKSYPKAQLVDVYKSFFQDNFGPGHLLGDTIAARDYFNAELADTGQWRGPDYEYTGEGKNFVRLNMNLIKSEVIPAEDYFQAFLNSLGQVKKPSDDYWILEWTSVDSIIKSRGYNFANEDNDRNIINQKIESKNFPIHHSDNFNDNYNFHYRIISLPEFEKLKKKYPLTDKRSSYETPNTIYDFKIPTQKGDSVSMNQFKGKVLLIVNTASKCGFTPQYSDLEKLYETYNSHGLEIIDFPCNQFGNQSPETDEETTEFCQLNYGTQFPQYHKIEVNGENQLPLYGWLKSQKGFEGFDTSTQLGEILDKMMRQQNPDYDKSPDIKWNFTKFLIDRNGKVVERFEPTTDMKTVEEKIIETLM